MSIVNLVRWALTLGKKAIDKAPDIIKWVEKIKETISEPIVKKSIDWLNKVWSKTIDLTKWKAADKIVNSNKMRLTSFLKNNPKVRAALKSKVAKWIIPANIAYNTLKDLELFKEWNVDLSWNVISDIYNIWKEWVKWVADAATNLAVNSWTDAVTLRDMLLKGWAWSAWQAWDILRWTKYLASSDEERKRMEWEWDVDYSKKFYDTINDLWISANWESSANETKALAKEKIYWKWDWSVYRRTLDAYNKSSWVDEYWNKINDSKKEENKNIKNETKDFWFKDRTIKKKDDWTFEFQWKDWVLKTFKSLEEAKDYINTNVKQFHLDKVKSIAPNIKDTDDFIKHLKTQLGIKEWDNKKLESILKTKWLTLQELVNMINTSRGDSSEDTLILN